jgi:hypothetical protein
VEVLTPDWPYAVRVLLTLAQRLADERGHANTSPAHLSHALYAMKPVRAIVAAGLTPTAVETALLVEKKATVTKAVLTNHLAQLVSGPTERTTSAFLRSYATGHATAQRSGAVFAAHADAIGAVLEHPDLQPIMSDPTSPPVKEAAAPIALALGRARKARHGELTTRHVVLGTLLIIDKMLRERGLASLESEVAQLSDLLDRTIAKADGIVVSARLFGAVAGVLAEVGKDGFRLQIMKACLEDDDAVAFAGAAAREALARVLAHDGD